MSLIDLVNAGKTDPRIKQIAKSEKISLDLLAKRIKEGKIVIVANKKRKNVTPTGIGKGLKTKINVNLGTSEANLDLKQEIQKVRIAEKYQADFIMDLSTGGDLDLIRKEIIKSTKIPLGTVPIYQSMKEISAIKDFSWAHLKNVIKNHLDDGVDFITVHCGVTKEVVEELDNNPRIAGIVSRGGSFLAHYILDTGNENPLFTYYDELLELVKPYDAILSLGDGLRPGCLADATDRAQIMELRILGQLAKRALDFGVQTIIEGPGHVPLDQIKTNVEIQKHLCNDAPFYVLGPLVTDIAPGYDHITSAIGGAMAASYGVDFLCYVTPAEHLRLPDLDDVKEGTIASKIAAHAADIVKGVPGALEWDLEMSKARKALDWQKQIDLSIDPDKAKAYRESSGFSGHECSMCGKFCSMRRGKDIKKNI